MIKGVSETIKNEVKEQKEGFLGKLSGTLGASLLGNLWTSKGTITEGERAPVTGQGQGTIRVGHDF